LADNTTKRLSHWLKPVTSVGAITGGRSSAGHDEHGAHPAGRSEGTHL